MSRVSEPAIAAWVRGVVISRAVSNTRYVVERARAVLNRLFGWLVTSASRVGLGRRFPFLRGVYFTIARLLRPGVTTVGPWTVYFHRHDNAVSHSLRNFGTYEPFELELIARLLAKGDCAVDVGANIGLHSLAMSAACGPEGKVLALEPDPANLELCERNLGVNGCANVELLAAAASDRHGVLELYLSAENKGDHRVYDPGGGRPSVQVASVPLDVVLSSRGLTPALIKVDVQGWETNVLKGAVASLQKSRRFALVTEFWTEGLLAAGSSPSEYVALLQQLHLDLYEIDEPAQVLRSVSADFSELLSAPRDTNLLGVLGIDPRSLGLAVQ